ncbi:MAG: hypothetical protein J5806_10745 [Lentisphaeria bacterium]|nr:hypothetical protein [Lentisphaeria bacterium]
MKKMLLLTAAALLLAVPELKAQDADEENPGAGAEKTEAAGAEKKSGDKKAEEKAPAKDNVFAGQQKKIQNLQTKLEKAKKKQKRRIAAQLRNEQNALRRMYVRETNPIKKKIATLKEQARLKPAQAEKLEKEIAPLEEKLKALEEAAELDKWCPDSAGDGKEKGDKKSKKDKDKEAE